MIDVQKIRNQFEILSREVNGKPLVYLDNAATSQKPNSVLELKPNSNSNPQFCISPTLAIGEPCPT